MRATRQLDDGRVPTEQRLDIGEVFPDRNFVALTLILFVPLVVIVEDQRDDVEEVLDEAVGCRGIDQLMEAAIEVRKVVVPLIDIVQQGEVFLAQGSQTLP